MSPTRALGYTPGHLTTVVRGRTGRPLLEWITERRMTEVRTASPRSGGAAVNGDGRDDRLRRLRRCRDPGVLGHEVV